MATTQFEQWPDELRSATLLFHLQPNVRFGPVLPDNRQQRVRGSLGHWIAKLQFDLALFSELRLYRAVITKAAGGVTEFFVPDRGARMLAPWPDGTGPETVFGTVALSGGKTLANGASFVTRVINVQAYAAAVSGATSMTLKAVAAGTISRGQAFTVSDATGRKRLYYITEPPKSAGTSGGKPLYTVVFSPALRGPVRAGTQVDMENPSCTMTLATPDTGQMLLEPYMHSTPTVEFRESFNGL